MKRKPGLAEPARRHNDALQDGSDVQDPQQPVYLPHGPFSEFPGLSHKHYIAVEKAQANDAPEMINPVDAYVLGGE